MRASDIKKLSYTDFVGLVNQWNVLPGAYSTLNKWAVFGRLNSKSKILEIACTTGFSSRELCQLTGCSGEGIDISANSVQSAILNKEKYASGISMKYKIADGYTYKPSKKFSHIIFGASLGFFPDPNKMLDQCVDNLLIDGGYILASPFYVTKKIPKSLVNKARKVFDITVTQAPYKQIMDIYNKFEILFEDRNRIVQETKKEIAYYAKCSTDRAVEALRITDKQVYKAIYDRLVEIKTMSNLLRPYQEYAVVVLRYKKNLYPNRYVELF